MRDNGIGMDQAELEFLRREICRPCQETEKGFGLANVNERIHMYFGEEYGLRISSTKGSPREYEYSLWLSYTLFRGITRFPPGAAM